MNNNYNNMENFYNTENKVDSHFDATKIDLTDKERLKDPIFKSIGYPSKIFYKNIQHFIKAYTKEDGIVIDTCAGSGSTGLAALLENRKCILIDNSPHAVNMATNVINPINMDELDNEYSKMISLIEKEINDIYCTVSSSGFVGYAEVIIASNVYRCPKCNNEIVLYKNDTGKRSEYKCPHCSMIINISNTAIKERLIDRRRPVEVTIRYNENNNKSKKEIRAINCNDIEIWQKKWTEYESRYSNFWSPSEKIVYNRSYPRIGGWPGFPIDSTVSDLFPTPNLLALKKINNYIDNEIEDSDIKSFMKFIFTETLFRTSSRLFTTSGIKNVYHIPPLGKEQNVLTVFKRKYKSITKAKRFTLNLIPQKKIDGRIKIIQGNAKKLSIISNSVDYAFIDPPYGGMVPYAELNLFYSSWLDKKEDLENEIIIPMDYEKKESYVQIWGKYIEQAFREVFRILRPGAYFTVVFHSKYNTIWNELRDIMTNRLGFEFINIIANERGTTFHTNHIYDTNPVSAFITYRKPLIKTCINDALDYNIDDMFTETFKSIKKDGLTYREIQSKVIFTAQEMSLDIPNDMVIKENIRKHFEVVDNRYFRKYNNNQQVQK